MNKDPNKTDRTNIPFIILDDMYLPAKNKLLNSLLVYMKILIIIIIIIIIY